MDRRERYADETESMRIAIQGLIAGLQTALPGIVQSFNPTACTAVVQPSVKALVTNALGVATPVNLPLLLDCPVQFPGGGGCTLTFPLAVGDEVLIVFASRCIDAWWQSGGVQPQAEFRMHDLSDGFVIPRVRSLPKGITISLTRAQLRSDDGLAYIELDPTGHAVNIVAQGAVNITSASLTHNGKNIGATHEHSGVQPGSSNTGMPI